MLLKVPNNGGFYGDSQIDFDEQDLEARMIEIETIMDEDFAEYLWMENEEEFDKIEMQRLEEEALMQQCAEHMRNIDDDKNDNNVFEEPPTNKTSYYTTPPYESSDYPAYGTYQEHQEDNRDQYIENKKIVQMYQTPLININVFGHTLGTTLSTTLGTALGTALGTTLGTTLITTPPSVGVNYTTVKSKLNPLAAEFIPRKSVA